MKVNTDLKIELTPNPDGTWSWVIHRRTTLGGYVPTERAGEEGSFQRASVVANWNALELTAAANHNTDLFKEIRAVRLAAEREAA